MVKLTAELIQISPQFINCVRDRQLDLRGYKIAVIENLGATMVFPIAGHPAQWTHPSATQFIDSTQYFKRPSTHFTTTQHAVLFSTVNRFDGFRTDGTVQHIDKFATGIVQHVDKLLNNDHIKANPIDLSQQKDKN